MGRNMVKEHHASISCRTEWSRVASTSRTVKNLPQFLNPCVRYRVHKPRQLSLSWARLTRSTAKKDLLKLHFKIPPFMTRSSKCPLFLGFPHHSRVYISPLPIRATSLFLPHYSYFVHPDDIWWAVQIMKLLTMQSSPFPCYLAHFIPKYLPQQTILQYRYPVLPSAWETEFHTHTQQQAKLYCCIF